MVYGVRTEYYVQVLSIKTRQYNKTAYYYERINKVHNSFKV